MNATALLYRCQTDGLELALEPPDTIVVRGPADARARYLPEIRASKPELVRLLAAHQAAVTEATAERAALAEYLGGLPRGRAEAVAEAAGAYYSHWSCPTCRHGTQVGAGLHRPCAEGKALWDRYCEAAGRGVRP